SLGLALIIQFIGFGRLIAAVGIGWLVGKAIGAATADLGGRRYQLVAVALTYFAIGLGSILPVVATFVTAADEAAVTAVGPPSGRGPFEANAAANESALYEGGGEDPLAELSGPDPVAELEAEMSPAHRGASPEELRARELRAAGPFRAMLQLLVLMVTLPLLGMFAYGIHGAVLGMFSLGFGMLKAWRLTDEGIKLVLTGPHRVGTGPITATF
ncbi:MAG TPA: hypothetical protein VNA89_13450, partial [Gemmatimonadaceae bacterium]|nr:hypothetical protein [Gemmatimonadaceae bacterium]